MIVSRIFVLMLTGGLLCTISCAQTKPNPVKSNSSAQGSENLPAHAPSNAPPRTERLSSRRRPLPDRPKDASAPPAPVQPQQPAPLIPDPDSTNISGPDHALYDAVARADLAAVKALLQEKKVKVNVNVKANGMTPLLLAANGRDNSGSQMEILKLLLDNGADVKAKNRRNETALYLAVQQGQPDVVRLLLTYKANPDEVVHEPVKGETVASIVKAKLREQPKDEQLLEIEKLLRAAARK
jgi:ankyrin repeat protein